MGGELRNEAQAQIEARLKEEALARIFHGLSPEAMRTLRAVAEMRNRSPQDVLRDELEGYILDKLPIVDRGRHHCFHGKELLPARIRPRHREALHPQL